MNNIKVLQIQGLKRITAVRIDADGKNVIIGGRNAQGKSSVLDAVEMALGGKKTIPTRPIKDGEDEARVVLEMDDLMITRTFTAKGSYLKVTTNDGASYPSAQAMLDSMIGKLALDPHRFANMKTDDQAAMLREMLGLDTAAIDKKRDDAYTKRTDVNREIKTVQAKMVDMPVHDDAPDSPLVVQDLMDDLDRANSHNDTIAKMDDHINGLRLSRDSIVDQIAALNKSLDDINVNINESSTEREAMKGTMDTVEIIAQIRNAERTNEMIRENEAHRFASETLNDLKSESDQLTDEIVACDQEKREILSNADYPIDGLGISDDGVVMYQGVPFDQASAAERLRVSAAIGLALNPKMGVLLIRDGSLLDPDSMRAILEYAEERGAQVLMERVGDADEGAVIIEDGEVLGADDDAEDLFETT